MRIGFEISFKNKPVEAKTATNSATTHKRSTLANPTQWLIDALTGVSGTNSGVAVNTATAITNSTVHGCVLAISRGVANMPLKKITNGESKYYKLINEPNPYMNGYDYRAMCVALVAYKGNSYSIIQRDTATYEPVALHPLPSTAIVDPFITNGELYYKISYEKINSTFPARDILHFKGLSISNPLKGENPISLHAEEIGLVIGATKQQAKSQKNGVLKFLVKSEKPIPETASANIKKDLTEIIDEDQSIAVLPNGAQVERLQLTPAEAQYLEARKYGREDICSIFGVPLSIFDGKGTEEDAIFFYNNCLTSYVLPIEQELERKLLKESEKGNTRFKFNFDSVLRASALTRAQVGEIQKRNGVANANEIRAREDMMPIDSGNQYYDNAQLIPADKMLDYYAAKIENLLKNAKADNNNNPDGNNNNTQT